MLWEGKVSATYGGCVCVYIYIYIYIYIYNYESLCESFCCALWAVKVGPN